jgi:nucleoside-diphosphate-sugar epimerase
VVAKRSSEDYSPGVKILVTGATGFVGSHLVDALLAGHHEVTALVRDPAQAQPLADRGVSLRCGDLMDPASLRGLADGMDAVAHTAAVLNLPKNPASAYAANVEGTRNLAEAVSGSSIHRFVHISSVAAIGIRNVHRIDENFACNPDLAYGKSKLEVDRYLIQQSAHGLPVVILRPPTVYGPRERYNFLSLCRAILSRRFMLIGSGQNRVDFCWVGNLVQAILLALERGRPGGLYLIADEPVLPFRETVETLASLLGRPIPRLRLPTALAYAVSVPLAALGRLTGREVPLYPKRVRTMASDMCFDLSKAKAELGYAPRGPFRELARETIEWSRQNGLLG